MGGKDVEGERAEAIGLLKRALELMDEHGFGLLAAPHVDLGLHLLAKEAGPAGDRRGSESIPSEQP